MLEKFLPSSRQKHKIIQHPRVKENLVFLANKMFGYILKL
jgi:hypothetical protein